ncbi:U-box domain-containing protein 33, partial [Mucuna pruriens]
MMSSIREQDDEESSSCGCGTFIGFKRNQVIGCSSDSEELFEINLKDTIREDEYCESTVFSLDIHNDKDVIYVAVDNHGDSSMEALLWTLKHAVTPSSTLCLLHVFPQVNLIPMGKIPRSHVNIEYVNMHLTQEKGKRKLLLQKFIDLCVDSKVKVEMMLIEGDNVAKAITDLVENLNIRKLVIGITTSNLRKSGSRRQNGIAAKVLKNAQESCDIKIVCEGREVIDQMIDCTSRSIDKGKSISVSQENVESRGFVPLKHFMSSSLWLFRSINKIR